MLRLLVFDKTDGALSTVWRSGAGLYRGLRRIDAAHGVSSWTEAFDWIASHDQPISELQYWGHGKWGAALVDGTDGWNAHPTATLQKHLDRFRDQLAPDALIWFRTCETFGARAGIDFAERLADSFGARVAGHTHIIGFNQSGLHALKPGTRADWSDTEGLLKGTPESPERSRRSAPWRANTITCLANEIPTEWYAPSI